MPSVGKGCHELRHDFADNDAVVILDVFSKKTQSTPKNVIDVCNARLRAYKEARG
jgi:phage-related protein